MQQIILGFILLGISTLYGQDVKVLDLKTNDIIYLSTFDRLYVTTSEDVDNGNNFV